MAQRNQKVLDMIDQLRARLVDLEDDVLGFDGDLSDLADKLDRIDDRVYLLETDIARRMAAGCDEADGADGGKSPSDSGAGHDEDGPGRTADGDSPEAGDGDGEDDGSISILTPEAKEKIGETVGDMRVIGREAAETFSELNEAFSDIASPFRTLGGRGRRR